LIEEQERKKKGPGRPRGRPRKHPLPNDRQPPHKSHRRQRPQVESDGRILVSTEQRQVKVKGRMTWATVQKYSDGSQTIKVKKSQLDPESLKTVNELQKQHQRKLTGISASDINLNTDVPQPQKSQPTAAERARYHFLSNLHREPPCSYPVLGDATCDSIFINSKHQLNPVVVCQDFLKPMTEKFLKSTPQNMNAQRAMFSMSSVVSTDIFDQLEIDPKWANNRQLRLIDETCVKLSDQQFTQNLDTNPIVQDILGSEQTKNNTNLRVLREKVQDMSLDELAEVLLPVLIERFSPADILLAQSRAPTDPSNPDSMNQIDMQKMETNLARCKRQLTWIKNNSRNLEDIEPPEKQRRAILTTDPEDPDEVTIMFDDEHQIDVANVQLELKLVLDCIKMLKTSTEGINRESSDLISSGFYQNFRRFDLGKSSWAPTWGSSAQQETGKQQLFAQVSQLADLNSEYIFSTTATAPE